MPVAIQRNPLAEQQKLRAIKRRGQKPTASTTTNNPTVDQGKIDAMDRFNKKREKEITGKNSIGAPQPDKISPAPTTPKPTGQVQYIPTPPVPVANLQPKKNVLEVPEDKGETAYDLRRQQISAQEKEANERNQEALKRRLASQGISGGGISNAQQRLLRAESRKVEASRKGEVDIQELLAKERDESAKAQREFQREERMSIQDFQSTETEKDRILNREFEQGRLSMEDRRIVENARQFDSKEKYDRWALEQGLDEAQAERNWHTKERVDIQAYEKEMENIKFEFQKEFTNLTEDLKRGTLSFASALEESNKVTSLKADSAYNLGVTGTDVHPGIYGAWSDIERAAYDSGKSGKSLDEYNEEKQSIIDYKNALITSLDVEHPQFTKVLNDILTSLGGLPEDKTIDPKNFPKGVFTNFGDPLEDSGLPPIPKRLLEDGDGSRYLRTVNDPKKKRKKTAFG